MKFENLTPLPPRSSRVCGIHLRSEVVWSSVVMRTMFGRSRGPDATGTVASAGPASGAVRPDPMTSAMISDASIAMAGSNVHGRLIVSSEPVSVDRVVHASTEVVEHGGVPVGGDRGVVAAPPQPGVEGGGRAADDRVGLAVTRLDLRDVVLVVGLLGLRVGAGEPPGLHPHRLVAVGDVHAH